MSQILVIDDEQQVRTLLKKIVEKQGYGVLLASDGKEGMDILKEHPVSLVITDIIMPEKEGLEIITEIKQQYNDIKIIAISGGSRIHPGTYLNAAEKLGADRTFEKPFEKETLLTAIKQLIGDS